MSATSDDVLLVAGSTLTFAASHDVNSSGLGLRADNVSGTATVDIDRLGADITGTGVFSFLYQLATKRIIGTLHFLAPSFEPRDPFSVYPK